MMASDFTFEALCRLRPGFGFSLDGEGLASVTWNGAQPEPVSQKELDDMRVTIQTERSARAYRAQRAGEYPAIGDQLDDLYKRGAFSPEMTARIKAVKDKYPKPSSV